jgi:endogenous inhibitor of DNA gyrase (YacG/DUF329 family)
MGPGELAVNCPTCGRPVVRRRPQDAPFFPFCCERCRLIDLGKWFDEEQRISEALPGLKEQEGGG